VLVDDRKWAFERERAPLLLLKAKNLPFVIEQFVRYQIGGLGVVYYERSVSIYWLSSGRRHTNNKVWSCKLANNLGRRKWNFHRV
jgi:hypothetical protein